VLDSFVDIDFILNAVNNRALGPYSVVDCAKPFAAPEVDFGLYPGFFVIVVSGESYIHLATSTLFMIRALPTSFIVLSSSLIHKDTIRAWDIS
jgi:hypothetical protein